MTRIMWLRSEGTLIRGMLGHSLPNKALQLTAYSVRSFLTFASGSS